jgi:hypothetical protein
MSHPAAADVEFARVERTLLSVTFDLVLDLDLDLAHTTNREGHDAQSLELALNKRARRRVPTTAPTHNLSFRPVRSRASGENGEEPAVRRRRRMSR